jgi:hypothetical protein
MANVRIPDLPLAISISGPEQFEIVQSGSSKRITLSMIGAYAESYVFGNTITVDQGGTGVQTLSGWMFGNGVSPVSSFSQIPLTDISGAGTAAALNIHVGTTAPPLPAIGDIWIDTN